jgi:hypothetical protein
MENKIADILKDRGSKYGDFREQASISQELKMILWGAVAQRSSRGTIDILKGERTGALDPYQLEALEMIFHKIARILNGDPNYKDSWVDIVGYAQLVVDRLPEGKQ